jgi:hypothetical protein
VDGLTATELEPHAHLFQELLPHTPDATFTTQTDTAWHKVMINRVPTRGRGYSGSMDSDQPEAPSSQQLLDELLQYNGWLRTRKIVGEPWWITLPKVLMLRDKSSIVVAFALQEDADELIRRRGVFMFGHHARTHTYIDIPPLQYCTNCWLLDHLLQDCKRKPRCRLCAGEPSAEDHKCSMCNSVGSACEHTITRCVHCPDSDSPHYADSFACPYRHTYKGEVMAAPKPKGGCKKKKSKISTTAGGTPNAPTQPAPSAPTAPPAPMTDQLKEAIHSAAATGVPSTSEEQVNSTLVSTNFNLRATLQALGQAIIHTRPDNIQAEAT